MKFDETGFNERCSKIFSMFDDSKQQNLRIVDQISEAERGMEKQKVQLQGTFERVKKETD